MEELEMIVIMDPRAPEAEIERIKKRSKKASIEMVRNV
jgi:hypothetical protein